MPYYSFDSFPEDKIESLADLCINDLKMIEDRCENPNRQWSGEGAVCLVRYSPQDNFPLLVQSWLGYTYKNFDIKKFIKNIVNITKVNQFYEGALQDSLKCINVTLLI
jgi:hypothetical protein